MKYFKFILCFWLIITGCTKDAKIPTGKSNVNEVKTTDVTNITSTTATIRGSINRTSTTNVNQQGVCWGTDSNITINNNKIIDATNSNPYSCLISKLQPGTTYFVRAFATSNSITVYGVAKKFTTSVTVGSIITTSASAITSSTAKLGGNVTADGGSTISVRGVCWSTTTMPTIANSKTNNGSGIGNFISELTGLSRNKTYYVRAYATNSVGTSYGEQIQFTTISDPAFVFSTSTANSITISTATSGGNITDDGGSPITAKGVCWSTSSIPTINNYKTNDGIGIGIFKSYLSDLSPNTTYFVRAYATNSAGTSYGPQIQFKTLIAPTVSNTTSATSITNSSALSGGNISTDGGNIITARGVCWSSTTTSLPTINNNKTNDGIGTGNFTSALTGLNNNTTYYVRAYATNSAGTSYGPQIEFTTEGPPTVYSTSSATSITNSSALSGGNISSDGGSTITARGVCWSSTTSIPTISNSKTNNGTGIGNFTSALSNLSRNTTYYVRAYATNAYGTSYGFVIQFKTLY